MSAVAVLASQTQAPRWAPETNSGQTQRPDTGRTQVTRRVRVISLMISSLCRIRIERSGEGGVGQPDRVPAVLPQLRRGSGQHLAVSISVLQKWWRSGINCTCVMSLDMAAFWAYTRDVKRNCSFIFFTLGNNKCFYGSCVSLLPLTYK